MKQRREVRWAEFKYPYAVFQSSGKKPFESYFMPSMRQLKCRYLVWTRQSVLFNDCFVKDGRLSLVVHQADVVVLLVFDLDQRQTLGNGVGQFFLGQQLLFGDDYGDFVLFLRLNRFCRHSPWKSLLPISLVEFTVAVDDDWSIGDHPISAALQ